MSEGKKEGNGKRRKFAIVAQKIDGQMSPIWYWNGLITKASGRRWDMLDMAITFEEKDKVIMDTVHALVLDEQGRKEWTLSWEEVTGVL